MVAIEIKVVYCVVDANTIRIAIQVWRYTIQYTASYTDLL